MKTKQFVTKIAVLACTLCILFSTTGCSTLNTLLQMGANGATFQDFVDNAGPLAEQAIDEAKPMVGDILTDMGEAMGEIGNVLQEEVCNGQCECTCGGCPAAKHVEETTGPSANEIDQNND